MKRVLAALLLLTLAFALMTSGVFAQEDAAPIEDDPAPVEDPVPADDPDPVPADDPDPVPADDPDPVPADDPDPDPNEDGDENDQEPGDDTVPPASVTTGYLIITDSSSEPYALYRVKGEGADLLVPVKGGASVRIVGLPFGEYTVTRQRLNGTAVKTWTITLQPAAEEVEAAEEDLGVSADEAEDPAAPVADDEPAAEPEQPKDVVAEILYEDGSDSSWWLWGEDSIRG